MKLRLIKEWNGKPAGATGVFLSDYGKELIADGIAELLDDDFVVEVMPEKKHKKRNSRYIFRSLCLWNILKMKMNLKILMLI